MQDVNRVQRIGHLGHDPEVKYTATGTARTTFSVATDHSAGSLPHLERPMPSRRRCVQQESNVLSLH